jgi:hypothetical protein
MKALLRLKPYFVRYKGMYIRGTVLVIFSSIAQAVWVPFFGNGIDTIRNGTATPVSILGHS